MKNFFIKLKNILNNNGNKLTKISIITPVLNGEKTLQKTIDSVLDQNFKNLEYIIVDGLSTDKTHEIIKLNKEHISKTIIEKDQGIYDAMNKGIKAAKGELIGIINSDDYYNHEAFNLVLKKYELSSTKNIIIYGDMHNQYEKIKVLSKGDLTDHAFKIGKFEINHPTVFVSKSLYKTIGNFDIRYHTGSDRDFLLRAHKNNARFLKIDKSLATFRLGGFTSSYTFKLMIDRTKEEFHILKKYYSKWYALRKSLEKLYRMLRNNIFYFIFGYENFLKARIKWLDGK